MTRLRDTSGSLYQAGVFVDASYEGDLLAAAGVPYAVGREGRQKYGEVFAGRREQRVDLDALRNALVDDGQVLAS